MKQTYTKFNSFIGLRIKKKYNLNTFLSNLKIIINNKKNSKNFNKYYNEILDLVKKDLFYPSKNGKLKFKLTSNVIKEIQTLDENKIPLYLVHRYRYEIYPQIKKFDDYPPYLQIEPTSICNYRCVFCYQTDNKFNKKSNGYMGHMNYKTFKLLIDQAEGNIEFISLASRGEPLLCPDIKKMLKYTKNKFLNLKINTNASLLNEEMAHSILNSGVKTLVFSADAADSKLYSKLRVNGKFEKIIKNIKQFNKIKNQHYSNSKIITRVSGVKVNSEQKLDEMENYWGDLVDQVAFVNYVPWENVYLQSNTNIEKPCSDLWRRMFVWWDGKINPCDVDYKSELALGKIKNKNISELWKSTKYNFIRHRHEEKLRSKVSPCNKCNVV